MRPLRIVRQQSIRARDWNLHTEISDAAAQRDLRCKENRKGRVLFETFLKLKDGFIGQEMGMIEHEVASLNIVVN